MMARVRTVAAAAATVTALALAGPTLAQVGPISSTTTTTAPDGSTTTTAPDDTTTTTGLLGGGGSTTSTTTGADTTTTTAGGDATTTSSSAPADDGESDPRTPRTVPPEAQKIIDSVKRSKPSNTKALVDGVAELQALGLSPEEAIRIGFGRFPVAGQANYVHDWLFPRYGPGFRFHLGTDVFAAYGTPLRAVVDGTATSGNSGLGGLYVKVFMPDGTYFYYAHLSALAPNFTEGMTVKTGDIVGFVGDSGNAKGGAPHVHFGVYPQGGSAVDPKPILDGFLADALARLPTIVEQVRTQQAVSPVSPLALADAAALPVHRPLLSTALLRPLTDRSSRPEIPTEALYLSAGNPGAAPLTFLEAQAQNLAGSIDWEARQLAQSGQPAPAGAG